MAGRGNPVIGKFTPGGVGSIHKRAAHYMGGIKKNQQNCAI